MKFRHMAACLRATSALGLLVIASTQVQAGGFALREQSAAGQGASFAGIAAGGALSSMYWNAATMTQFEGKAFEMDAAGVFPTSNQTYTSSGLATALGGVNPAYKNGVDNSANNALVPASYSSWQINERLWLGLAINSPFGLSVSFPQTWAGSLYGQSADVRSINFAPAVAYKFNDMISVSAGAQVQYMRVSYDALATAFPATTANLSGSGYAYGFTLGATITPWPTTTIGIGYRSALDQKIDGTLSGAPAGSNQGSISTTLNLPGTLTVGLRQRIGDRFTLLAGFEWANWSRIGTSTVTAGNGAVATIGASAVNLPFQYSDGYFYSLGGEYVVDPALTLRAGIAFEQSPITDGVRTPRLPDNDRMWYSAGLSYKPPQFAGLTFDLGYSFIDVKDTPLNLGTGSGNPWSIAGATGVYVGSAESHIHILSFGLRYQWDAPQRTVITKG